MSSTLTLENGLYYQKTRAKNAQTYDVAVKIAEMIFNTKKYKKQ